MITATIPSMVCICLERLMKVQEGCRRCLTQSSKETTSFPSIINSLMVFPPPSTLSSPPPNLFASSMILISPSSASSWNSSCMSPWALFEWDRSLYSSYTPNNESLSHLCREEDTNPLNNISIIPDVSDPLSKWMITKRSSIRRAVVLFKPQPVRVAEYRCNPNISSPNNGNIIKSVIIEHNGMDSSPFNCWSLLFWFNIFLYTDR
mmetsp:Transcript_30786/g.29405  ORF Transcript_30786/g.29405 Transcript_30786/m.29405 type:complete len:206 (+) Transcript_30786:476-1093(+)